MAEKKSTSCAAYARGENSSKRRQAPALLFEVAGDYGVDLSAVEVRGFLRLWERNDADTMEDALMLWADDPEKTRMIRPHELGAIVDMIYAEDAEAEEAEAAEATTKAQTKA